MYPYAYKVYICNMLNELTKKELETIRAIRNYLIKHGRMPSVRELMVDLKYKSPRSVSLILEALIDKGVLSKKDTGKLQLNEFEAKNSTSDNAQTVKVPLLGSVACGLPIIAEENVEAEIPVSVKLIKPNQKYFLLRASGDSMNEAEINDGDLVLVKQQQVANDKDLVVALIDDEATIKEFHKKQNMIILKPKSNNPKHQPIILTENFRIQGIVETVIPI